MARLNPGDVRDILQALEDGMSLMPKLDRMEKMRMRSKIRKQVTWLSGLNNPTAEMVLRGLQEKLSDALSRYPYGFGDSLKRLVEEKITRLRQR